MGTGCCHLNIHTHLLSTNNKNLKPTCLDHQILRCKVQQTTSSLEPILNRFQEIENSVDYPHLTILSSRKSFVVWNPENLQHFIFKLIFFLDVQRYKFKNIMYSFYITCLLESKQKLSMVLMDHG